MYRYLVTMPGQYQFFTNMFDFENFMPEMTVYDIRNGLFTDDGIELNTIQFDSL